MADKEARANIKLNRWAVSIGSDQVPIAGTIELTLGETLAEVMNQRLGSTPMASIRTGAIASGKLTFNQVSEVEWRYLMGLATSGDVAHAAVGALKSTSLLRFHDPSAANANGDILVHAAVLSNWQFGSADGKRERTLSVDFRGEIDATTGNVWSVGAAVA